MSRYSLTLLIHAIHYRSSLSYLGNSNFTRIWCPCVDEVVDNILNRGPLRSSCSGVLGEFGCGSFDICNLSRMAFKTSRFLFWSAYRVRTIFSIRDVICVHFDVKASLVCSILAWSSSQFLLIFSLSCSSHALNSPIDLVMDRIISVLNAYLFLFVI